MSLSPIWAVISFSAKHAVGGIIGGVFGLILGNALKVRIAIPRHSYKLQRAIRHVWTKCRHRANGCNR